MVFVFLKLISKNGKEGVETGENFKIPKEDYLQLWLSADERHLTTENLLFSSHLLEAEEDPILLTVRKVISFSRFALRLLPRSNQSTRNIQRTGALFDEESSLYVNIRLARAHTLYSINSSIIRGLPSLPIWCKSNLSSSGNLFFVFFFFAYQRGCSFILCLTRDYFSAKCFSISPLSSLWTTCSLERAIAGIRMLVCGRNVF